MGHYFFHLQDDKGRVADEEGAELPDIRAAFAEARLSVSEYLSEAVPTPGLRFEITDDSGRVVLVVPFERASSKVG